MSDVEMTDVDPTPVYNYGPTWTEVQKYQHWRKEHAAAYSQNGCLLPKDYKNIDWWSGNRSELREHIPGYAERVKQHNDKWDAEQQEHDRRQQEHDRKQQEYEEQLRQANAVAPPRTRKQVAEAAKRANAFRPSPPVTTAEGLAKARKKAEEDLNLAQAMDMMKLVRPEGRQWPYSPGVGAPTTPPRYPSAGKQAQATRAVSAWAKDSKQMQEFKDLCAQRKKRPAALCSSQKSLAALDVATIKWLDRKSLARLAEEAGYRSVGTQTTDTLLQRALQQKGAEA